MAIAGGRDLEAGEAVVLLELADRVAQAPQPLAAFQLKSTIPEQTANRIRSVARCFVSDVEDQPWYHDRAMWRQYLSRLAAQRFNRFSLTLGIGYDFSRNIQDWI